MVGRKEEISLNRKEIKVGTLVRGLRRLRTKWNTAQITQKTISKACLISKRKTGSRG